MSCFVFFDFNGVKIAPTNVRRIIDNRVTYKREIGNLVVIQIICFFFYQTQELRLGNAFVICNRFKFYD